MPTLMQTVEHSKIKRYSNCINLNVSTKWKYISLFLKKIYPNVTHTHIYIHNDKNRQLSQYEVMENARAYNDYWEIIYERVARVDYSQ